MISKSALKKLPNKQLLDKEKFYCTRYKETIIKNVRTASLDKIDNILTDEIQLFSIIADLKQEIKRRHLKIA